MLLVRGKISRVRCKHGRIPTLHASESLYTRPVIFWLGGKYNFPFSGWLDQHDIVSSRINIHSNTLPTTLGTRFDILHQMNPPFLEYYLKERARAG
jgi:hypothetical protein